MSLWDALKSTNVSYFPVVGGVPCWKLTGSNSYDSLITALATGWLDDMAANNKNLGGLGNLTMNGVFTNPSQPGIEAVDNAGFTLTSSAFTSVALNAQGTYNVGGMHSTTVANTKLTAVVAGNYLCGGQLQFVGGAGGAFRAVRLIKNGSAVFTGAQLPPAATDITVVLAPKLLALAVNDFIEIQGDPDSGGPLTLRATGSYAFAYKVS